MIGRNAVREISMTMNKYRATVLSDPVRPLYKVGIYTWKIYTKIIFFYESIEISYAFEEEEEDES